MQKRGFSHIEVILAFMIFISATLFVFYFFNPTEKKYSTDYVIDGVYDKMEEMMSANSYNYGVMIKKNAIVDPPSPSPPITII